MQTLASLFQDCLIAQTCYPAHFLPWRSRSQSGTGLPTRERKTRTRVRDPYHSEIAAGRGQGTTLTVVSGLTTVPARLRTNTA